MAHANVVPATLERSSEILNRPFLLRQAFETFAAAMGFDCHLFRQPESVPEVTGGNRDFRKRSCLKAETP
jgi:hypothetical protein